MQESQKQLQLRLNALTIEMQKHIPDAAKVANTTERQITATTDLDAHIRKYGGITGFPESQAEKDFKQCQRNIRNVRRQLNKFKSQSFTR